MRRPEKKDSAAAGSFTFQKTCVRLAPIVRMSSIMSGSTDRKPETSDTVIGKKVVSTTSTTLGARP